MSNQKKNISGRRKLLFVLLNKFAQKIEKKYFNPSKPDSYFIGRTPSCNFSEQITLDREEAIQQKKFNIIKG